MRRRALVIVLLWVVAAAAGYLGHERLPALTAANEASYLPRHSQSTETVKALGRGFQGGNDLPALIVFARDGGDERLTRADRRAIGAVGGRIDALHLRGATPALDPLLESGRDDLLGRVGLVSRDGLAAIVPVGLNADVPGSVTGGVHRIRAALAAAPLPPGLEAYVAGPAGIAVDLEEEADDAGRTLLYVTTGLVLLLLLAVYRAPLLAVMPLISVACAYLVTAGIAYLLLEGDVIVANSEGTMLLLVLIFGVGTDYSLLLVHRYRDELATGAPPGRALRRAVAGVAPALAAAGGTVIAAMLVLLVADLESTKWLGPLLALGVAVMLLAAFTLLPAMLALVGPRAFWPARDLGAPAPAGVWPRVAGLVRRRSGTLIVGIVAALAVASAGNLVSTGTIGFGQGVGGSMESARGTEILDAHFPPGLSAPLTVLLDADAAPRAVPLLNRLDEVATAVPAGLSPAQDLALLGVILDLDPFGEEAMEVVEDIRSVLAALAPDAAVGGITAENLDVERANARDTRVIVPLVLLVMLGLLALLLRALVAPLYLVASVVGTLAASLGVATVVFTVVLGQDGLAFDLGLMAFIFLVALGIDYTIFLMHRVREEAAAHGTREGVLRALVATGSVVSGAGVILAGTFATLVVVPLEQLVQVGGTIAFGVLLDTFVVRALLVPAITLRLGDRAWWPARPPGPSAGPPAALRRPRSAAR